MFTPSKPITPAIRGTTKPSRPRVLFGVPRSVSVLANQWALNALELLATVPAVSVSIRVDSCYVIRDMERTPILMVSIPVGDKCCGVEEDEMNFKVTTTLYQPLIHIETYGQRFCRGVSYVEGFVKFYPDTYLGIMEGDINTVFFLKTNSGDNFCAVKNIENECGFCSCSRRSYEVKPLSSPHDMGSIMTDNDKYLIVTFPRVFDIHRRTILLSCVINMQYQIEAERRRRRSSCFLVKR
ncbi:uncharacterized protein LOC135220226 [Macrobrachium nipponense]|uniref:uncharacterized protein LOC135220226 n=1 Tax=Macrobrachium nipponense TaxID=159736 RepID=UPI0030C7A725